MAHATTHDDYIADPDLREPLRIIRRQRSLKLVGVVLAISAAVAVAFAYASLSYNDRDESVTVHLR